MDLKPFSLRKASFSNTSEFAENSAGLTCLKSDEAIKKIQQSSLKCSEKSNYTWRFPRGTPKSSYLLGFSIINQPFLDSLGYPWLCVYTTRTTCLAISTLTLGMEDPMSVPGYSKFSNSILSAWNMQPHPYRVWKGIDLGRFSSVELSEGYPEGTSSSSLKHASDVFEKHHCLSLRSWVIFRNKISSAFNLHYLWLYKLY